MRTNSMLNICWNISYTNLYNRFFNKLQWSHVWRVLTFQKWYVWHPLASMNSFQLQYKHIWKVTWKYGLSAWREDGFSESACEFWNKWLKNKACVSHYLSSCLNRTLTVFRCVHHCEKQSNRNLYLPKPTQTECLTQRAL